MIHGDAFDYIFDTLLLIAVITTTAFPVLYAFFGWKASVVGRAMMYRGIGFSVFTWTLFIGELIPRDESIVEAIFAIVGVSILIVTSGHFVRELWFVNFKEGRNNGKHRA